MNLKLYIAIAWLIGCFGTIQSQSGNPQLDALLQNYESSISQQPSEQVYIHTDKRIYVTGETVWMNLYCLDAAFHTPSEISSVAYIELLDESAKPILQERVTLSKGLGSAYFFIDPAIPSAVYYLRAYTQWMRNTQPVSAFELPIVVVNPAIPPKAPSVKIIDEQVNKEPYSYLSVIPLKTDFRIRIDSLKTERKAYLIAHSGGIIHFHATVPISEGKGTIDIPRIKLPDGTTYIELFDAKMNQISSKKVFQRYKPIAANFTLSKESYGNREPVVLSLQGLNVPASLSVSVHKISPNQSLNNDLESLTELWPTSMEKGIFDEQIDWNELLTGKKSIPIFPPEMKAPTIKGKISGEVPQNVNVSFPGAEAEIYHVPVQSGGDFQMEVSPRLRQNEMLFWAQNDTLQNGQITVESPFISQPISRPINGYLEKNWQELLESYNQNVQINHLYGEQTHVRGQILNQKPPRLFYGEPSIEYILDDYTRFPSLGEVFLEYIGKAQRRSIKQKRYVYIWDEYKNIFSISNSIIFDSAAMTLIDGIPILDPDFIWPFDVFKVERIDVIPKIYYSSNNKYAGIIHFQTYKHDFGGRSLPSYLIRQPFIPIQEPRQFYSPNYAAESSLTARIPDYRTTLYWNPLWEFSGGEESIRFFTGDDVGWYQVEVTGITDSGQVFELTERFEVKEAPRN